MNGAAFMTTTQAAAFLGISPRALWMLKNRGTLRESGRMGSKLLWCEADLRRQLTGDAVPSSSPVVLRDVNRSNHDEEAREADERSAHLPGRQRLDRAREGTVRCENQRAGETPPGNEGRRVARARRAEGGGEERARRGARSERDAEA